MSMNERLLRHRANCISIDEDLKHLRARKVKLEGFLSKARQERATFELPYVMEGGGLDLTKMPKAESDRLDKACADLTTDIANINLDIQKLEKQRPKNFLNSKTETLMPVCCGERNRPYVAPVLKQSGFINVDPTENIFQAEERMVLEDKVICIPVNDQFEHSEVQSACGVAVYEMA